MKKTGCIFIAIPFLIVTFIGIYLLNKYNTAISKNSSSDHSVVLVTIDPGDNSTAIRQKLIDNGIIKDENIIFGNTAFQIYSYMTKFENNIKAGSYELSKGSSIENVAVQLQKNDIQQTKITIKEGLRIEEISDEINRVLNTNDNKLSKFNKNDFITLAKNYPTNSKREFLNTRPQGDNSLEGYLFPDTFYITNTTTASDMIDLMLDDFDQKIYEPYLGAIKINKYSLHQLITISSIIQREVRTKDDMAMVADIFFRRLSQGWKLEADSTVQYALGYSTDEGVWWKKELTAKDLNFDSPYNTRKNPGIPPGPIDSFGQDAFISTLQPKANNYYYYLSDNEGITRFAVTNQEQLDNEKKYLGI